MIYLGFRNINNELALIHLVPGKLVAVLRPFESIIQKIEKIQIQNVSMQTLVPPVSIMRRELLQHVAIEIDSIISEIMPYDTNK
jgi:hypothetical protein